MPIESTCEIVVVSKGSEELMLELKFDNGTTICLEKSEKEMVVRGWKRKYEYFLPELQQKLSTYLQRISDHGR